MQAISAVLDDDVGHHAIAVADLRVEDAVFNLGFLHSIGRGSKVEVGCARKAFRRVVGDAVQSQPVVSGDAVYGELAPRRRCRDWCTGLTVPLK